MKHFINFSGGVDSTYYLWKFLKENPSELILAHHCLLFKKRREVEQVACHNILKYFKKKGLKNFQYTETSFERGGIRGKIYDIEPLYFLAGMILKRYSDVKHVYIPICKEELGGSYKELLLKGKPWSEHKDPKCRFHKSMTYCNTASGRKLNYHTPYFNVTKKQMIEEMPKELVDMIWYCRSPHGGKPCGSCFNCKRVKKWI